MITSGDFRGRRVLLCLLPGLGDALTASTIVRRLRAAGYEIDVLTMLRPVAEYAAALEGVRRVENLPLLSDVARSLWPLLQLRHRRYDLCILPFPATRWQYAAVARFIGAKRTVSHRYGGLSSLILSAPAVIQVDLAGGHRLWENDRLADACALPRGSDWSYEVPASWRRRPIEGILGVHPGTMVYKGNEARRWPFEAFVELIRLQLTKTGRRVRVFFGPSEADDERALREECQHDRLEIVSLPLDEAARMLSECEVFVGNDAGFSHLSAALGVKTLVLFGMTNPVRAAPAGPAVALRPSQCPPCHDEGLRGFPCALGIGYRCLNEDLPVSLVASEVERLFNVSPPSQCLAETSDYQLYGVRLPAGSRPA